MKKSIIVTTDFSASSVNALNYACKFARDYYLDILLVHIYTIPGSYAAEGLSVAAINDALDVDRERLNEELERVKSKYVNIHFEAEMVIGDFLESLQELKKERNPALVIIGAIGEYSDLWQWDNDWLNALITVPCPVMVIPPNVAYSPIMRIAFATDHKKVSLSEQAIVIKKLVNLSNAKFYVVHVAPGPVKNEAYTAADLALKEAFEGLDTQYHTIENRSVIKGVADFIKHHHIDLLLVMPHRHGLWHSLFNKSYTKQLALLNDLPVMAIHEVE